MHEPLKAADFAPKEGTLAAIFPTAEAALKIAQALDQTGLSRGKSQVFAGQSAAGARSRAGTNPDPVEEVAAALEQPFSDDSETFSQIQRALYKGSALIAVDLAGREEERAAVADWLRANGATAVVFWGALTTERL